jgi:radical SAM protein with 4Fe4S-binding SPASM domain
MWSDRVYFDAPLFVQFDCTNRCNLRCKHCVTNGGEPFDGELSTDEALKLIRALGRLGVFQIGFSGGEPLTRNDLFTLMQEAINLGMKVQLTTNALLVDEEKAKRLSLLEPITVGVSLEGGSQESYEFFRGKGNFDRFLEGVKTLKKFGLPVKFKTAILRKNLGEIDSIINLAIELGVEAVDMFLFYPQGRGKEFTNDKLTPEEIREFLTLLSIKRKELEGTITIDVDDKPNAFLVDPTLSHSTCGAGVYWAEVLPTGEIVPCIFFREVNAGNIKEEDFKEAWDSKIWEPFRDRRELRGRCGTCMHLARCGGGCRANGYALTGDFLAEDTMCWYDEKTQNS